MSTDGMAGGQRRPSNVLVVMTDQQKATASHLYGSSFCETPSMERLARQARVFVFYFLKNKSIQRACHLLVEHAAQKLRRPPSVHITQQNIPYGSWVCRGWAVHSS